MFFLQIRPSSQISDNCENTFRNAICSQRPNKGKFCNTKSFLFSIKAHWMFPTLYLIKYKVVSIEVSLTQSWKPCSHMFSFTQMLKLRTSSKDIFYEKVYWVPWGQPQFYIVTGRVEMFSNLVCLGTSWWYQNGWWGFVQWCGRWTLPMWSLPWRLWWELATTIQRTVRRSLPPTEVLKVFGKLPTEGEIGIGMIIFISLWLFFESSDLHRKSYTAAYAPIIIMCQIW